MCLLGNMLSLQGESNSPDPGIYETGMNIFNYFIPKPTTIKSNMDNFPSRSVPTPVIHDRPASLTQYPVSR
jgi:hypothetical protein